MAAGFWKVAAPTAKGPGIRVAFGVSRLQAHLDGRDPLLQGLKCRTDGPGGVVPAGDRERGQEGHVGDALWPDVAAELAHRDLCTLADVSALGKDTGAGSGRVTGEAARAAAGGTAAPLLADLVGALAEGQEVFLDLARRQREDELDSCFPPPDPRPIQGGARGSFRVPTAPGMSTTGAAAMGSRSEHPEGRTR